MWNVNFRGEMEFAGGKDDFAGAAQVAAACLNFLSDVEEELVADEAVSCYNCRYRRWSAASFTCRKHAAGTAV